MTIHHLSIAGIAALAALLAAAAFSVGGWAVRGFHTDIDRQEMTDSEVMTGATQGVILLVMCLVFAVGFGIGLASGFWWSA